MGTRKQRLLLLGLCLLACLPLAVHSACCTIGQPTYIGQGFSTLPAGGPLPIGTCSDGSCVEDGVFNYLQVGGVQSQAALSCCELFTPEEEQLLGWYYNPKAGSKYPNGSLQVWYAQSALTFPGTGRACDTRLQRFQCEVAGEQVPTCQDVFPVIPGPQPFECPAGYKLDPAAVSTKLTTETCCLLRCPDIALLSQFPDAYPQSRPSANLSAQAQAQNSSCVKAPSLRLGSSAGLSITQPLTGVCKCVAAGPWDLKTPVSPPGTAFDRWECYNITTGTPVGPVVGNTLTMTVYDQWTCVAIFTLLPPPKLALLSEFPTEYNGPSANLKALINGTTSTCTEAPSTRYDGSIVTVLNPGPGFCGPGDTGFVPPGSWSLEHNTPSGTVFERWECWNITTGVKVSIPFPVELSYEDIVTCVAIYSLPHIPSPSPSPSPVPSKLAIISQFPANYTGPGATLIATSPNSGCLKSPSQMLNRDNVTVVAPGLGQCGPNGTVPPGDFSLTQIPPPGTVFVRWDCYDITTGAPTQPIIVTAVPVKTGDSWTCVAVYDVLGPSLPSPSPSVSPRTPAKLAIISQFPANYTGPGANLVAVSPDAFCFKNPSQMLGRNNVTILAPGSGQCGPDGTVPTGNFSLTQVPPSGTKFERWECYDITTGMFFNPILTTNVAVEAGSSWTCVAVYSLEGDVPLPSPSPNPGNPKLALLSQFPVNYTGPTANLAAQSSSGSCVKVPSPRRSDNITVTNPGPGWCGPGNNGEVPPGQYNLVQNPPTGTVFVRWDCYKLAGPNIILNFTAPANITLAGLEEVTCVAVYDFVSGTCADVTPTVSGSQQYTCSRSTLAFNQSALSTGPPSDVVCCQATCSDTNITAGSAVRWTCPANMTYNMDADMATRPSDRACCISRTQAPFTLVKTGPVQNLTAGQAFTYFITVVFFGPAKSVKVTDFLPAAVNLSSTTATWRPQGGSSTACVPITQLVPQQLVCDLGANTTWNAGNIVEIIVPAVAGLSAASNVINTATISDDQNLSASDTHPVNITASDATGVFSITKIGPTPNRFAQNSPFLFDVTVVFLSSARGVKIVDDMPAGLAPSGTATWLATQTSTGINNGTCETVIKTGTTNGGYVCDLGVAVTWARGDRIVLTVPAVTTAPLVTLTNKATVWDDLNRTATANATVVSDVPAPPNALLSIVKDGPTTPVGVGEALTFTILVRFDAEGPFTNAVIMDDLPVGILPSTALATWTASNRAAGVLRGNCSTRATSPEITCDLGASVVWALDDLVTVTVPAVAGPSAGTNLVNTATINATYQGKVVTVSDTHPVNIVVPTLTISKLGPGVEIMAKQNFTWTVSCGVEGTTPVRSLILVDELQSTSVRFVLPMPPNCTLISNQKVQCIWNETVLPGNPKVVQLTATSDAPGVYENFATVSTSQPGVASKNATAEVVTTDEGMIDPSKRNVNVTKTGPKQPVSVNTNFDYVFSVSSNVPVVSLTDSMDASTGVSFVAVTPAAGCILQPQLLRCNLTAPFPKTVRLTARGTKPGTFTNNAIVQSSGGGDDDGTDVIIIRRTCATWYLTNDCPPGFVFDNLSKDDTVTSDIGAALACCVFSLGASLPDLQITKVAQKTQVRQGDIFNYTIEVKHLGIKGASSAAFRVTVTDELPVGVAPVSADAAVIVETGKKCDLSGPSLRIMTCNLGDLEAQEKRIIQVKVKADGKNFEGTSKSKDVLKNKSTVKCRITADSTSNDYRCTKEDDVDVTVTKEVTPAQDSVDIVKSVTPLTGDVPTTFTFTITLDPGKVTANDVVVEDKIPPQLTDAKLLTPYKGRCKITTTSRRAKSSTNRGLLEAHQAPSVAAADPADTLTAAAAKQLGGGLAGVLDRIRDGGGNKPKQPDRARPSSVQQTLRCEFAKLSKKRDIKYTAVARVKGTWRNVAVATPKNGNSNEDDAVVTVTDPIRPSDPTGSCCDSSFVCREGVLQSVCTGAGGSFSDNPAFNCASGRFCTGACCAGGGTTSATCTTTRRDMCEGSMFSINTWSSTGDCNSASFCPKPTQCYSQCQPCDATRPCCSGFACLPAGNGWTSSNTVCMRTSCCGSQSAATSAGSSDASTPSAAAAGGAEPAAAVAAGAKAAEATCSHRGGICGRHQNGLQCCGPKTDCIVGEDMIGKCQSRRTCKQRGSKCDGAGECCSGQICGAKTGVCERATCETPSTCDARDYLCKYWYDLGCEIYYSAAASSADR